MKLLEKLKITVQEGFENEQYRRRLVYEYMTGKIPLEEFKQKTSAIPFIDLRRAGQKLKIPR